MLFKTNKQSYHNHFLLASCYLQSATNKIRLAHSKGLNVDEVLEQLSLALKYANNEPWLQLRIQVMQAALFQNVLENPRQAEMIYKKALFKSNLLLNTCTGDSSQADHCLLA